MSRAAGEPAAGTGGELLHEVVDNVATVTLNRPDALNALSLDMLRRLDALLDQWQHSSLVRTIILRGAGDRAFCAGGDVRAVYQDVLAGRDPTEFFRVEYALDYRIHTFPKPIVAVIDGIVMGGGMGISQGAALRSVGPRTRMAMPETAIGLFPDVGASYFLSRAPGRIGLYLGLVGTTIEASDAIYARLADDFAPGYVEPRQGAAVPHLQTLRPAIDRHFGAGSVRAIIASLEQERDAQVRPWAVQTVASLRRRSPTMLQVTFEQLRRGATMSLAECFRMELNLMHACLEHADMREGIRAMLVDKDNAPFWRPSNLEDVAPAAVERFFTPRWRPEQHPLAHLEQRYGYP